MPRERKSVPLAVYVQQRVGLRRGLRALTYLVSWGLASERSGGPVSVSEYTDFWRQSLATSYKEREAFLMVWPDEESPERLWSLVRDRVAERRKQEVALAQLLAVEL